MAQSGSEPNPDLAEFRSYVPEGHSPKLHVAVATLDPFTFCPFWDATAAAEFRRLNPAQQGDVLEYCRDHFITRKNASDVMRAAILYRVQRAITECGSHPVKIWRAHFKGSVTDRGFRDWFATGKIENRNLIDLMRYFPVGDPGVDELDLAAVRLTAGRVRLLLSGKKRVTGGRTEYPGIKFPSTQEMIFLDGVHKLTDPSEAQLKEVVRMSHLHEVRKQKSWRAMWGEWGPPFRITAHAMGQLERELPVKLGPGGGGQP